MKITKMLFTGSVTGGAIMMMLFLLTLPFVNFWEDDYGVDGDGYCRQLHHFYCLYFRRIHRRFHPEMLHLSAIIHRTMMKMCCRDGG